VSRVKEGPERADASQVRRVLVTTPTTRRIGRWMAAGALVAGVAAGQPAFAGALGTQSPDPAATAPTAAPPASMTTTQSGASVQSAADQLAAAEKEVSAATVKAQQLAYAVVALHDQLAAAQTAVDAARVDARNSIRIALDQADIDPTETLFVTLSGNDPGLAGQVRDRQLGDVAARTEKLNSATAKLSSLNRQVSKRLEAALGAAAQAVSAADKARTALVAAQKTDQEVRARATLAAERAELDKLNAELAESLAAISASSNPSSAGYAPITATNLPASLRALYMRGAATCPGLPWNVLAGIGQVETDHGQNKNVSSAGAMGPMQFMPATWAVYGVDGDGDGVANILDQADAIFSAAHYLCADGGGNSATLYQAIFAYNHSDYYVNTVLGVAAQYH
jgi:Transglycosylase SLT domain